MHLLLTLAKFVCATDERLLEQVQWYPSQFFKFTHPPTEASGTPSLAYGGKDSTPPFLNY